MAAELRTDREELELALEDLDMRIDILRRWANNRIAACQREEERFGTKSQTLFEAATERRTLQAVIRILDGALTE